MTTDLQFVRNIGIAAHVDAGKQHLPNVFFSTLEQIIALEKFMTPPPTWTTCPKKKNMESRLPPQ